MLYHVRMHHVRIKYKNSGADSSTTPQQQQPQRPGPFKYVPGTYQVDSSATHRHHSDRHPYYSETVPCVSAVFTFTC